MESGIVNEIAVDRIKADFEGAIGRLTGRVQVQSLTFPRSQLQYWPQQIPELADAMVVKSLNGRFVRSPSTLDISDVQGYLTDSKSRFVFDAGWADNEELHGTLQIYGDRKKQNFKLTGTRKAPHWN
jgi:hypothetical protein